MALSDYEVL